MYVISMNMTKACSNRPSSLLMGSSSLCFTVPLYCSFTCYCYSPESRQITIYIWKILESIVSNLNNPITCYNSIRRGRLCVTSHVGIGHLGTLVYHSFRFRGIRLFNAMSKHIRNISGCSVSSFKYQLDKPLNTIPDIPCVTNYDNSLEISFHTNIHLFNGVHPV